MMKSQLVKNCQFYSSCSRFLKARRFVVTKSYRLQTMPRPQTRLNQVWIIKKFTKFPQEYLAMWGIKEEISRNNVGAKQKCCRRHMNYHSKLFPIVRSQSNVPVTYINRLNNKFTNPRLNSLQIKLHSFKSHSR